MATQIILIIHIIISLSIIFLILINKGKGAEIGATFGSDQESLFGSHGSNSFIRKIIIFLSITFVITCISMTLLNKNKNHVEPESVVNSSSYNYITNNILEDNKNE